MIKLKQLSVGVDSTLGNWYSLCCATFGKDSAPSIFLKEKIDKQGENTEVITDERQLLYALGKMFSEEFEKKNNQQ